jgi:hypothetical protein
MKLKSTLSAVLVLGAAAAFAQPTITAATSIPAVGLSETLNRNTLYLPGNAGANQTWDFSTETFSSSTATSYEACGTSNDCSVFPGTTLVNNTSSSYIYFVGGTNALSINGYGGGGASSTPYSNPEDFFRFPFTYGNSYVDTWAATVDGGAASFYRTGIDSVSADGWGTLITPAGTFPNTLRVKRVMTYQDSANIGGMPLLLYYTETLYTWNDVSHKDILFSTYTLTTNNQGAMATTTTSTYVSGQPVTGIKDATNNAFQWHIAPNPAHDQAQVTISLTGKANVSVSLIDITGREVYHTPANNMLPAGNNQLSIPTSNLPAGIYVVRMVANSTIATGKLVIQ